jgi:MYXO-CTERM domain-containing protein
LRATFAATALLALAPLAHAGPIQWSYSSTAGGEFGHNALNLGVHSLLMVGSNNETSGPVDFYATQYTLPTGTGQVTPVTGSERILLASLTNNGGTQLSETVPAEPTDNRFKVSVMVTDRESGQSGTLDFFGRVDLLAGSTTDDPLYLGISGEGSASLVLGRNRYDFRVSDARSETVERLVADVTVSAVAATPEPTSFALGALGLGALGLVRRVRRQA